MPIIPFLNVSAPTLIARALVLLTALPFHEFAHAFVATKLGDETPRRQGRYTLNPLAHLDPIGSVLILFAGFGWARPVQINPLSFKNPKRGSALVAAAGPLSNVLFALVLMIALKLMLRFGVDSAQVFYSFVWTMLLVNLSLAVFNLLPIPPLDGSRILTSVLPFSMARFLYQNEQMISMALMALVVFGFLRGPISFLASQLFALLDLATRFIG